VTTFPGLGHTNPVPLIAPITGEIVVTETIEPAKALSLSEAAAYDGASDKAVQRQIQTTVEQSNLNAAVIEQRAEGKWLKSTLRNR
jgi:hypothetical protein